MIEHFKSALLLLLVLLSLVLTYQLWYGEKPAELTADDVYERVVVETPRPMENLVTPARITAFFEDESFLFRKGEPVYENLWVVLSQLLQDLQHDEIFAGMATPEEDATSCIVFYFNPVLPVGEEMPWFPGLNATEIEKIKLYCSTEEADEDAEAADNEEPVQNEEPAEAEEIEEEIEGQEEEEQVGEEERTKEYWLLLKKPGEDTSSSIPLTEEEAEQFIELLSEIPEEKGAYQPLTEEMLEEYFERDLRLQDSIYVPAGDVSMPTLSMEPEDPDEEKLLKTFFVDYNLVRTIEEGDGGVIYTDGGKGLRVTDSGLEYSNPRKEEGHSSVSYREALRNSSRFISYHGGWPENLRLEDLVFSSRGRYSYYESEWVFYHDGYPVYVEKPTRVHFNDLGLFNYSRSLFFVDDLQKNSNEDELAVENSDDPEDDLEEDDLENGPVADWVEALQEAIKIYDAQSPVNKTSLRLEAMEPGYVVTGTIDSPVGKPVWRINLEGEAIYLSVGELQEFGEEEIY